MFLNNRKLQISRLIPVIQKIIQYYCSKDARYELCVQPEAKYSKRARSLLTLNAIIDSRFFPNPYKVVSNEDGTYTWTKGFPLPQKAHRKYTVRVSATDYDFCSCAVFLKWSYCKHTLATVEKFQLHSRTLGQRKFKNHSRRGRGRLPRNSSALQPDTPAPVAAVAPNASLELNVAPLIWTARNSMDGPEGWVDESEGSDVEF
jgi:hypothetical protein